MQVRQGHVASERAGRGHWPSVHRGITAHAVPPRSRLTATPLLSSAYVLPASLRSSRCEKPQNCPPSQVFRSYAYSSRWRRRPQEAVLTPAETLSLCPTRTMRVAAREVVAQVAREVAARAASREVVHVASRVAVRVVVRRGCLRAPQGAWGGTRGAATS